MRELAVGAVLLIAAGSFILSGAKRVSAKAEMKLEPVPHQVSQDTPESRLSQPQPSRKRVRIAAKGIRLSEDLLACIRRIESGGRYDAVSPGGRFLGAYQFTRSSFINNFGTDDPSEVSPERQDALARDYLRRRGLQPWPLPSRRCRGLV